MQLLNKGLKYNLDHKHKKWIETSAIEADTATNLLPDRDQNYMRQLVANNIQKRVNKQKTGKTNVPQPTPNTLKILNRK
jgi:hypothetical protein